MVRILLRSCDSDYNIASTTTTTDNNNGSTDSFVDDSQRFPDSTPDGMDGLQWEEEVTGCGGGGNNDDDRGGDDDEWSKLYTYYARVIEQTGAILSTTVKAKDPHCLDAYKHAPIHYAAILGDCDCTELLLRYNCPVDIRTPMGFTALHLAFAHVDVVRLLLAHNADPNKQHFHTMETALHTVARVGCAEVAALLCEAGARINAQCIVDRTPLLLAIACKNFNVANVLIDRGAKLNIQDAEHFSPLYMAVIMRNRPLAERLLRLGARSNLHSFLLHYCVRHDLADMIALLIDAGAYNVNQLDQNQFTPVALAIQANNATMLQFLLIDCGAALNRPESVFKELHSAVRYSVSFSAFRQLAGILLQNGANIDLNNNWGEPPLMHAMLYERYKAADWLIKEGADVNAGICSTLKDTVRVARHAKNINLLKMLGKCENYNFNLFWS